MSAELLIYAIVAAGLVFWLRNILGTRHGEERERSNPAATPDSIQAQLDNEFKTELTQDGAQEKISDLAKNPKGVMSIDNKSAENGLLDIANADKSFDIKFFLDAAQDVFAMVVETFAEGDRETLRDLLGDKVYNAFESAITDRETKEHKQKTEIQSIQKARVIEAKLEGKKASVTIRFEAQQVSTTLDKDGATIEGNANRTVKMIDIWTFGRDVKSKDPRWLVIETRGDFEGDNELIPDTE
ncbi:Tim44/TimA family putative adaptor protein [Alphaproteobacteria bacterium]|nr:Tim44/TimA family putative adaptor protein [Alphaproteobacteria bacterium]